MPVWIAEALSALAGELLGPVAGVAGAAGATGLAAAGAGLAAEATGLIDVIPGFGFGGGFLKNPHSPKRHRRRKALTQSDMNQAMFIASSISKKAAENFILSRVRSS